LQGEVPLIGKAAGIFWPQTVAEQNFPGELFCDGNRVVRAESINHNNFIRPADTLQAIPETTGFIECQNYDRDGHRGSYQ